MMHRNLLHTTVKMGVIRLNVLILIIPTVQCHMTTLSESTLILWLYIDSLPGFLMPVIISRIKYPHSWKSLCQSTTLWYILVWEILPQCFYQSKWRSISLLTHEWNSGGEPARRKCNWPLDTVVKILKYKKGKLIMKSTLESFLME